MKKKVLFVIILTLLMVSTMLTSMALAEETEVVAEGTCGDNVTWSLDSEGTLTISGSGAMTNSGTIPSVPWSPYKDDIKQVIVEEGVTSIRNYAFYSSSSLASITIPDSVTSIGTGVFMSCSALEEVHITDWESWKNISFRDESANPLNNGAKLYLNGELLPIKAMGRCGINVKWDLSDDGVLTISGSRVMSNYSSPSSVPWSSYKDEIKQIVVEDGVTSIGNNAFNGCSGLISVTIPNSVTSIGSNAFNNCSNLAEVHITDVSAWGNISFGDSFANPLNNGAELYLNGELLPIEACGICGDNVTWTLSDDGILTVLGTGEMNDYSSTSDMPWNLYKDEIKQVVVEDGVTRIGKYAFDGCSSLISVTISDSVTSIGGWAFQGCSALKEVHINDLAAWCSISFNISNSNPLYKGAKLYLNDELLTDLVIPDSVTSIGSYAFYGCSGLTSVTIFNSVTNIGGYAFGGCSGLTFLTIPNSIMSISQGAFQGCSGLTSITIPDSVTSIGGSAFRGCSGLTSVTISNSVKSISDFVFDGCSSLTSVTIPDGVKSIGREAFNGCSSLTSITIPDSVKGIGGWTFDGCSALKEVHINDLAAWCGISFYYVASSNPLRDGAKLYLNDELLTDLVIPDSVASIGKYAFYGCSGLTSVTIPNSVTSIGQGAFFLCSSLKEVHITDLEAWEKISFDDSSANPLRNGAKLYLNGELYAAGDIMDEQGNITGCSWTLLGDTLTISGSGPMTNFDNYGINIAPWSYNKQIQNVIIEDGVTSIGNNAFNGCSGLASISIPDSVTSIGSNAFDGCSNLKEVHITNLEAWKKISFGNDYANPLNNGAKLYLNGELVQLKAMGSCGINVTWKLSDDGLLTISGSGAMSDYSSAFAMPWSSYSSEIKQVVIENSVTTIGNDAFNGCSGLTSITISSSVTVIGSNAFEGCSALQEVHIKELSVWQKMTFGNESANPLNNGTKLYLNGELVQLKAMGSCGDNIVWMLSEDDVLTISGSGAMSDYSSAFGMPWSSYSSEIKQVVIENGVTSIGGNAFSGCSALTSITIPSSVTTIGENAFSGCEKLAEVHITDLSAWQRISFGNESANPLSNGGKLHWGEKILVDSGSCGSSAGWILYGDGTLEISGSGAMDNYASTTDIPWNKYKSEIKNVIIPDGVTSIGSNAFNGCVNLEEVNISDSVQSVGNDAFNGCSSLSSVFLPDGITAISAGSFSGCSALTSITIPSSVTTIGENAFSGCNKLSAINIPVSVKSIGRSAFNGCTALGAVKISDLAAWCNIAFENTAANPLKYGKLYLNDKSITDLVIPNGVTAVGNNVFAGYKSLKSVVLPEGITSVGSNAFFCCTSLTDITMPSSMINIGSYAFSGCPKLSEITIPQKVDSIDSFAFSGCWSLEAVHISDIAAWNSIAFGNDSANPLSNGGKLYLNGTLVEEPFVAEGNCGDNIKWKLYESGTLKISGKGSMDNYSRGSSYPWYKYRSQIKSVVIEEGITDIGYEAFEYYSALTSVSIPKSVEISRSYAFNGCSSLREVHITNLAAWNKISFDNNSANPLNNSGAKLYLNGSLVGSTETPGSSIVASGSCGENIRWELDSSGALIIMGKGAMNSYNGSSDAPWYSYKSQIKEVVIGNGITSIGDYAFCECSSLTSVIIPESVTSIEYYAFIDCSSLKEVHISDIGAWCKISFGGNPLSKGAKLYLNGEIVTDLVIPEGVTSIGGSAFADCSFLTSVVIPEGVTSIGNYAFGECSSLASVVIPESVTSISWSAFSGCSSLKEVHITDLEAWDNISFGNKEANPLSNPGAKLYLNGNFVENSDVIIIFSGYFSSGVKWFLNSNGELRISGNGSMDNYSYRDIPWYSYKSQIKKVVIDEGVTNIGSSAFSGCSSLASVVIPEGVTSIGSYAFDGCSSLKEVHITNLEAWNKISFGNEKASPLSNSNASLYLNGNLVDPSEIPFNIVASGSCGSGVTWALYINGGLRIFGNGSMNNYSYSDTPWYSYKRQIKKVVVDEGVTSIGDYAFWYCDSLTSVVIPESVTCIYSYAFSRCSSLKEVHITNLEAWNRIAFGNGSANPLNNSGAKLYLNGSLVGSTETPGGSIVASGSCGENIRWKLDSSDVLIIMGKGAMNSYAGSSEAPWYSYTSQIKKVVIDEGVTSIGGYAFWNCDSLTSVVIPESVTSIDSCAFLRCSSLTSVAIPKGVTRISLWAFEDCSSLTSVVIPEGVTGIGYDAFNGCSSLKEVHITDLEAWDNISFSNKEANPLSNPGAKLYLNGNFVENSDVYIIASGSFDSGLKWFLNSNGELRISGKGSMDNYGSYYSRAPWCSYCSQIKTVVLDEGVTSIGDYAFDDCSSLTSVVIPEIVTSIGGGAFSGCSSLTSVVIPEGVTSIGDYAFDDCSSLTSVVIPEIVTSIGGGAFRGCNSLISVVIPEGVTSIGYDAFEGCSSLTSVVIPESVTTIGDWAFRGCSSLTSVVIPESVTSIGSYAFGGCSSLPSVVIPEGVTNIGSSAFSGCSSLTSVVIPGGVTSVGSSAFNGCSSLKEIHISDIRAWCKISFSSSSANPLNNSSAKLYLNGKLLTDLLIPEGVTSIGNYAFEDCSSLTSVVIPESVTSIGDNAFNGCIFLKLAEFLGDAPASFGANVFDKDILICVIPDKSGWTIPRWNGYLISYDKFYYENRDYSSLDENNKNVQGILFTLNESKSKTAMVGDGTSAANNSCYAGEDGSYVRIPDVVVKDGVAYSVNGISTNAFSDNQYVKSLEIGKNVSSIGVGAFNGCTNLQSFTVDKGSNHFSAEDGVLYDKGKIQLYAYPAAKAAAEYTAPDTVRTVSRYTFDNSKNLKKITLPATVTAIQENAFNNCSNLEEISLPFLGKNIYSGESLKSVLKTVPTTLKKVTVLGGSICSGAFINLGNIEEIHLPAIENSTVISANCFNGCKSLNKLIFGDIDDGLPAGSIRLPEGIADINLNAFIGCSGLKSVELPDSLQKIGKNAFENSGLESLEINGSLQSIGEQAFLNCKNLKNLDISGSVQSIGSEAFKGCSALQQIDVLGQVKNVYTNAFVGCSALEELNISGTVQYIGISAFEGCGSLQSVNVTGSIQKIGNNAFKDCTNLNVANLSDSLQGIGEYAFYNTALKEIVLPDTMQQIGDSAFRSNLNLKNVQISGALQSIGSSAFRNCTALKNLEIIGSVESIGAEAFKNCISLSNLELAASVQAIGNNAFQNCTRLEEFTISGTVQNLGVNAFSGCDSLTTVNVPGSLDNIGSSAFAGCQALENFNVTGSLLTVGNSAFSGCTALKTVNLSDSLQSIGDYAFQNSGLEQITLPATVTSIGGNTFYDCSALQSVNVDEKNQTYSSDKWGVLFDKDKSRLMYYPAARQWPYYNVPDSVEAISGNAFRNCGNLVNLYISEDTTGLGNSAIVNCPSTTICCWLGSAADTYASEHNLTSWYMDNYELQGIEVYHLPDQYEQSANHLNWDGLYVVANYGGKELQLDDYSLSFDRTKVGKQMVTVKSGNHTAEFEINLTEAVTLLGDIDGNKKVNNTDFNLFRLDFGKNGGSIKNPLADIDGNKKVNNSDFNLFRQNFGKSVAN